MDILTALKESGMATKKGINSYAKINNGVLTYYWKASEHEGKALISSNEKLAPVKLEHILDFYWVPYFE